jgi:hypothetical protein
MLLSKTMQEVFLVVQVLDYGEDKWLIKGRAYAPIEIGDILCLETFNEESSTTTSWDFRVLSIFTYGEAVSVITTMVTGELLVEGKQESTLLSTKYLYKKLSNK